MRGSILECDSATKYRAYGWNKWTWTPILTRETLSCRSKKPRSSCFVLSEQVEDMAGTGSPHWLHVLGILCMAVWSQLSHIACRNRSR